MMHSTPSPNSFEHTPPTMPAQTVAQAVPPSYTHLFLLSLLAPLGVLLGMLPFHPISLVGATDPLYVFSGFLHHALTSPYVLLSWGMVLLVLSVHRIDEWRSAVVACVFLLPCVFSMGMNYASILLLQLAEKGLDNFALASKLLYAWNLLAVFIYTYLLLALWMKLLKQFSVKKEVCPPYTREQTRWSTFFFVALLIFLMMLATLTSSSSFIVQLFSPFLNPIEGEFSNPLFTVRLGLIIAIYRGITFFVLLLLVWLALPRDIMQCAWQKMPQLISGLSTTLVAYFLIIGVGVPLRKSMTALTSLTITVLFFVVALICIMDCFRLARPKVLWVYGLLVALLLFGGSMCLNALFNNDALHFQNIPSTQITTMFIIFATSFIHLWILLGCVQLGLHRIYKKANDDYATANYLFNRSFFAKLFCFLR